MITKEMFKRYVKVQASGVCNMWSADVQRLAKLTKDEHLEIIKNYEKYEEMFDIHINDFK